MKKDLKEYRNMYNRKHYKSFSIRLHYDKEIEIIDWLLYKPNVKKYIVDLINDDIKRCLNGKY